MGILSLTLLVNGFIVRMIRGKNMTMKTMVINEQVEEVITKNVKRLVVEVDSISEIEIDSCDLFNCDVVDLTVNRGINRNKYFMEIECISVNGGGRQYIRSEIIAENYCYAKAVTAQFRGTIKHMIITGENLISERDKNSIDRERTIGLNVLGGVTNVPSRNKREDIPDIDNHQMSSWDVVGVKGN